MEELFGYANILSNHQISIAMISKKAGGFL